MSPRITLDVRDLPAGSVRPVDAEGEEILLCHAADGFHAIENRCPHAMVRLDGAALDGCILECPLHGGRLDVRDGSPQGPPIRRRAVTYPLRDLGDGTVAIEWE